MITSLPMASSFRPLTRRLVPRQLGDLGARGVAEFSVGVRVAAQSPASLDRFGEKNPGPRRERGISGCVCDEVGELTDYRALLVAVERPRVREHLDAHIVAR